MTILVTMFTKRTLTLSRWPRRWLKLMKRCRTNDRTCSNINLLFIFLIDLPNCGYAKLKGMAPSREFDLELLKNNHGVLEETP